MAKTVKLALLAGVGGATYAAVQAYRRDDTLDSLASSAARTGAQAAAVAGGVGLLLDLKAGRKRRKLAKLASRRAPLSDAARRVGPALEHALEVASLAAEMARPRVEHAIDSARPKVEQAIEASRPKVERAAERTAEAARTAADRVRPQVGNIVDGAKPMVEQAARRVLDSVS